MSNLTRPVMEELEGRLLLNAVSAEQFATASVFTPATVGDAVSSGAIISPASTEVHRFVAQTRGRYRIAMLANGSGIDTQLSLYNTNQQRVRHNDNASPFTTNSAVWIYCRPGDEYFIVAGMSPNTQVDQGTYKLQVTTMPVDDYGNTFATAAQLHLDSTGSGLAYGRIQYFQDIDIFSVTATQTGTMQIGMNKRWHSGMLDSHLSIYDSGGSLLSSNDNASPNTLNAAVSIAVTAGQQYYIQAGSEFGTEGDFVITVSTSPMQAPSPEALIPGDIVRSVVVETDFGSELHVLGTDGNDIIVLGQSGQQISVYSSAGLETWTGSFSSITVHGFDGDDTIRLLHTLAVQTTVYAGPGNDVIYDAQQGAGLIDGGEGDDLLVSVGNGGTTVVGGGGFNSYWIDADDNLAQVSSEESAARTVHRISQFYQPSAASPVPTLIAGQDLVDPAITSTASGYRSYSHLPLFVNGPSYDDIAQGYIGDCYFLASLASLSEHNPESIYQSIAPLGDGTYAVRFFGPTGEVYLRIDADLPIRPNGSLAYAKLTPQNELWVALLEKAYAFFRYGQNSYASINGGWMSSSNFHITGLGSTSRSVTGSQSLVFNFMQQNLNLNRALTVGSVASPTGPIAGSHAYMIKSVQSSGGTMTVTLYNPWGYDGYVWDSNPSDGLVTLTMQDFQNNFTTIVASLA